MSTVLVTGGTGYVASHVVAQLLRDGYQVRTTVRKCLEDGVSAVWPGCDIWPTVPPENVRAMLDEVANYRR